MAAQVASDEQLIEALRRCGNSATRAARDLGINVRTVERRMPKLARKGWSPEHDMTHPVPDGFMAKGVSTYYNKEGKRAGQWVKSNIDLDRQAELLRQFVAGLADECRGLAKPIKAPKQTLSNSLSSYIIGDAHFGMYAWAAEAGEDFDTAIASKDLRTAIDLLVEGAPASEVGYLIDVGDFLHADNRSNVTPASGNLLDVDSRYQKVIRIARDALRYCIGRMLEKHKRVEVFITPGNHNPDSAGWLAMVLEAYYETDKRVRVETSPSKFYYQRFGKNLIGITHGDKIKRGDLAAIMASDRAADWGQTEHRYWWTGHIHHTRHEEYRGCFVESFNTLASSDAWHHANGYRSARQMQRIDLDKQDGIYNRGIVSIGRVRRAQ